MIPFHAYADLFPLIEGAEFDALVADIKANGVREPIMLLDGKILDGRNRYRAGLAAGFFVPSEEGSLLPHPQYLFDQFDLSRHGDPLRFVISKNLNRRHLSDRQRASIAGKIANLSHGGDRSKPPIGGLTIDQAAAALNVAPRQAERARAAHEHGVPELREALDRGEVAVSVAEQIARLPEPEQKEKVARIVPGGARAIMGSRAEPDDSLDYFPTPPWATRALFERVLPHLGVRRVPSAWEPACGEGHIAEVLREYVDIVHASDIFDYGYGEVRDFLAYGMADAPLVDWIITNPPFGNHALAFVEHALKLAGDGVAMFFRSQWAVEGIERYERLFRDRPPTLCAFFVERVPLAKGRWDPDGATATAYCWLVWMPRERPLPPYWIPPGCREALTRADDRMRFMAHPVARRDVDGRDEPGHDDEGSDDDRQARESRVDGGQTAIDRDLSLRADGAAGLGRHGACGKARAAGEEGGGGARGAPAALIPSPRARGEGGERSEPGEGRIAKQATPIPHPPPQGGREQVSASVGADDGLDLPDFLKRDADNVPAYSKGVRP